MFPQFHFILIALRILISYCYLSGRTSLIWASVSGQMTSAATLMDAGADINHADKSGMTALDHAVTFIDDIDVLEGEGKLYSYVNVSYFSIFLELIVIEC